MAPQNAFYAQSGGVTAVINASAAGVIETARQHKAKIGKVYAGRHGILGALTEDLIDTSQESAADIARLKHTPAGAFGSARYQLQSFAESRAPYDRLMAVFQAHDIGYFFYNGGGDSADTCLKVAQVVEQLGYPLVVVHIPKTVDNDLPITDCCPGFGSAAKYVATSIREAAFDVASMAKTSTRVFILEVMGRHAGWITAACGLAAEQEGEAPHILLFPEIPFEDETFLARVEAVVQQHGYCVIGVSEGLRHPDGRFLAASGWHDAFGKPPVPLPLGGRGLSAARGAPYRLQDRCAAGLCGGQGGSRVRLAGLYRDHADHRARVRPALHMDHRHGEAGGCRQ
jgi:6-phosphofructokinase 1